MVIVIIIKEIILEWFVLIVIVNYLLTKVEIKTAREQIAKIIIQRRISQKILGNDRCLENSRLVETRRVGSNPTSSVNGRRAESSYASSNLAPSVMEKCDNW